MKTFEEAMFKLGQTEALCDELGAAFESANEALDLGYDALIDRWRASRAARGET